MNLSIYITDEDGNHVTVEQEGFNAGDLAGFTDRMLGEAVGTYRKVIDKRIEYNNLVLAERKENE